MATVSAVRDGLRARLATIAGLRTYDLYVESPQVPAAIVLPASGTFITFDTSMSHGSDDMFFRVTLLVSQASVPAGQDILDVYLSGSGSSSVRQAIETDPTLGGVAHFTEAVEARNYGLIEWAGVAYFGCEVLVTVGVA